MTYSFRGVRSDDVEKVRAHADSLGGRWHCPGCLRGLAGPTELLAHVRQCENIGWCTDTQKRVLEADLAVARRADLHHATASELLAELAARINGRRAG